MRRVKVGEVGVDSGQIVVCDPCYIESQWKKREFEPSVKAEVTRDDGTKVVVTIRDKGQLLVRWDDRLRELGGNTLNQMYAAGRVVTIDDNQETGEFSYDGCARASLSERRFGQLKYKLGHVGVAVCCSTLYGDGSYPVYAELTSEGKVRRLIVDFDPKE